MSAGKAGGDTRRSGFDAAVYSIVARIPTGRLMTYGQIAQLIPPPPGLDPAAYLRIRARWVGYALAECPGDLPWHRVVNRQGKISARLGHGPHVQPQLLEEEGLIPDRNGAYDLDRFGWDPDGPAPGPGTELPGPGAP